MEYNTKSLENFLGNKTSSLDRYGFSFRKGESSSHVGKNNNEEPKMPIEKNSNNNSDN